MERPFKKPEPIERPSISGEDVLARDSIYEEPSWSGSPPHKFVLEVIKDGSIVDYINIYSQNYYLLGRVPSCDISLQHPSISRQHCVIQHHRNGQCFVYDLASTHGVVLNRERIKPGYYYNFHFGDVLRLGRSSRTIVLGKYDEKVGKVLDNPEMPQRLYSKEEIRENKIRAANEEAARMKDISVPEEMKISKSNAIAVSRGGEEIDSSCLWGFREDIHDGIDDETNEIDERKGQGKGERKRNKIDGKTDYDFSEENDNFYEEDGEEILEAEAEEEKEDAMDWKELKAKKEKLEASLIQLDREIQHHTFVDSFQSNTTGSDSSTGRDQDEMEIYLAKVNSTILEDEGDRLASRRKDLVSEIRRLGNLVEIAKPALEKYREERELVRMRSFKQGSKKDAAIEARIENAEIPKDMQIVSMKKVKRKVESAPLKAETSEKVSKSSINTDSEYVIGKARPLGQDYVDPPLPPKKYRKVDINKIREHHVSLLDRRESERSPVPVMDTVALPPNLRRKSDNEERVPEKEPKRKKHSEEAFEVQKEEVIEFFPPEDQRGDGISELNRRFGY